MILISFCTILFNLIVPLAAKITVAWTQLPYLDIKEQDGSIFHWLGIADGVHLSAESQAHSGKGRKSWNGWTHRNQNSSENHVLDPARVCMQLLKKRKCKQWQKEVICWFKDTAMMFADLLHSMAQRNQDGTGRCSSLWSPHSLHGCCRNPACKRLHRNTERDLICYDESTGACKHQINNKHFTWVADSSFLPTTVLIVPLGGFFLPFDVNLNTVLTS